MAKKSRDERIVKWANDVVALVNRDRKLETFDSDICLCGGRSGSAHVHKGIDEIAKALNCKVECKWREDDTYPYVASLVYKDVRFFELRRTKSGK